MTTNRADLLNQLTRQAQRWAVCKGFDAAQTHDLRHQLILANHDHYRATIPAYQKLCDEEGISTLSEIAPITAQLMSTDDLFKSYNARWLDDANYAKMSEWLGQISSQRAAVDVSNVTSVDEWVTRLAETGLRLVYSSGTSGKFSFIPRSMEQLAQQKAAAVAYLAPLLYRKIGGNWQNALLSLAAQYLTLNDVARWATVGNTKGYDALFLDFRNGRTGMQLVGQELAGMFREAYYLYEAELNATTLRAVARGVHTEVEQALVDALRNETVTNHDRNMARIVVNMEQATTAGQKFFIFSTPFQLKSLGEYLKAVGKSLALRPGSLLFFGGGWKAFSGEQISREALVQLISETLGLAPAQIVEGYSMVELNIMNVRCDEGRFHIPPLIEPLLFDEELLPMEIEEGRGIFGFLDPLATAYPGFLITGDMVRMVNGQCACGLEGPAITEIGRAVNRDVKGCAGVMAAVRA